MKRIISLLLVLVFLTGCAGDAKGGADKSSKASSKTPSTQSAVSQIYPAKNEYKEWTYNVLEVADRLLLGNRCPINDSEKGIIFDQAGANFAFNADCEGEVKIDINSNAGWSNRLRHYTVYIDGVRQERIQAELNTASKQVSVTVATALPRGVHEIKVCRSNPAEKGSETVQSITLNGVICEDKPQPEELLIEFLGDSLTAGLGNLDFENGSFDAEFSDSTQTYAYFTAEAFGADFSSVCCGGLPFTAEYGGMGIKERYNRVSFSRQVGNHDFARPADIVVVNLATNDHGRLQGGEITDREFIDKAKELVEFIRLKNPNCKVIWAYGMATNPAKDRLTIALQELGGEAEGLYFCDLPRKIAGEKGHPVVESHRNAADVLIQFMKDKLGLKEVAQ